MDAEFKYYVQRYWAECEEDSFEQGIIGSGSNWGNKECPVNGTFDTIREAIKAVCDANGFMFRPEDWEHDPCGDDTGRFDADIEVTNDNAEASEHELDEWREGRKRLWCCHLAVFIGAKAERAISEEEVESWMN